MFTRRISWGAGHFQLIARTAFVLVALAFALSTTTLAQSGQNRSDSALAAKVRALNNQLLQLHAQFQQGLSGNGAAAARSQAATVIAARAAALQSLIQQDPRAALSFAFSPALLADLAAKFPRSVFRISPARDDRPSSDGLSLGVSAAARKPRTAPLTAAAGSSARAS